MPDTSDFEDKLEALKTIYLSRLDDSMSVARACCDDLIEGQWDRNIFNQLQFIANNVTGSGKIYGFQDLSDAAQILSNELNDSKLRSTTTLTQRRQDKICFLVEELLRVANRIKQKSTEPPSSPMPVYSFIDDEQTTESEDIVSDDFNLPAVKTCLLIVGGRKLVRNMMNDCFQKNSFNPLQADTIQDGLRWITDGLPDLVLLISPLSEDDADLITTEIFNHRFIRKIPVVRVMEPDQSVVSSQKKLSNFIDETQHEKVTFPLKDISFPFTEHYIIFPNEDVLIEKIKAILKLYRAE